MLGVRYVMVLSRAARSAALAVVLTMAAATVGWGGAPAPPGHLLRLQVGSFDPTLGSPPLPAVLSQPAALAAEDYYLVQFQGPVLPEWLAEVQARGGVPYGYVPSHAYVVKLKPQVAADVARLPEVRWVGRYEVGYRVSPQLFAWLQSTEEVELSIVTFQPEEADQIETAIRAEQGVVEARDPAQGPVLRARVRGASIPHLARIAGVAWIEPHVPHELLNDQATALLHADDVWATPGLTGSGQTVAVCDTGLDLGVNTSAMHPDFQGRIAGWQALGRGAWDDPHGHGTHVAGSALGDGTQSSGLYTGVAPEASLYFQSVLDSNGGLGGIPTDLNNLFAPAYSAGARLHTNSWGSAVHGQYTTDAWNVDRYAWDHKDFLILFAAGNKGADANADGVVDADSLYSPGTAKNCLTVGASENNRPALSFIWGTGYGAPIATDGEADDVGGLAAFSSRGPTDDGRQKPDLVAPGTWVCSARSRVQAVDAGFESGALPSGWTAGTGWAVSSASAHQGTYSLANGTPSASYGASLNSWVYLPTLDLRAYATGTNGYIEVAVWTRYNIQNDGDKGWLVVKDQTSTSWYGRSFTGSTSGWVLRTVGIDPSRTTDWSQVRIALMLQTNASNAGGPYYYLVDDVRGHSLIGYRPAELGLSTDGTAVDESYQLMGGTSMATPLVAGGVALLRQYFVQSQGLTPSAALLKATLIATADDLTPGQYGTGTTQEVTGRPDRSQGWGRANLKQAIAPDSPARLLHWDVSNGLPQADTDTYAVEVTDASKPLRVALVWTDPAPASPSVSPQLVNDLDLTVTDPAAVPHLPMGGAGDHLNNVETVDFAAPALGLYTITVEGHDINGADQPYALVVSGAATAVDATPGITQVSPASVAQGTTDQAVAITGSFTHFASGTSEVNFSGTGLTVNSVTVSDATHLVAHLASSPSALLGKREVMVTTGAEAASRPDAIEVVATSLSVSVTPSTWALGTVWPNTTSTTWIGATPALGGYFTATNGGTTAENLRLRVANSANWTAGSAPGENVFAMGWGQTATLGVEPGYTVMTNSGGALVSGLASGASFKFDLQCRAPTASTSQNSQSIVVTIEAQLP